jgi:hypothetical protein
MITVSTALWTCIALVLIFFRSTRSFTSTQLKSSWHSRKKYAPRYGNEINPSRLSLDMVSSRRDWWRDIVIKTEVVTIAATQVTLLDRTQPVYAKTDCYTDCYKNCKVLAPKDDAYCSESCVEYCDQDDRQDGLSGSVGSEQGEVGILGGSFGTGTVVKGQDVPPSLGRIPGLDFTSESGKKLIGY